MGKAKGKSTSTAKQPAGHHELGKAAREGQQGDRRAGRRPRLLLGRFDERPREGDQLHVHDPRVRGPAQVGHRGECARHPSCNKKAFQPTVIKAKYYELYRGKGSASGEGEGEEGGGEEEGGEEAAAGGLPGSSAQHAGQAYCRESELLGSVRVADVHLGAACDLSYDYAG